MKPIISGHDSNLQIGNYKFTITNHKLQIIYGDDRE